MTETPRADWIDYADGIEARVIELLHATGNVSAGSPELAELITSWETAYHFSPQRLGLLGPFRICAGMRIVDIGCGSGVLTRALGETGAHVVGIEGMPKRAAAAAERCRDLPNVRIECADVVSALGDVGPYDLALVCGVLEYSDKYGDGPRSLLAAIRAALAADGAVVIAIENQLGLKYLLGGAEDHHEKSWIGLAGYPGDQRAPHTWSRGELAGMLADAGLAAQRWLLPYPDYKLPRVILDEAVFDRPDAVELVDKLVREPLRGTFRGNDAATDGRTPHRIAVAAGIGALLAPSFLVVAAGSPDALARVTEPGLGWLNNDGRRPEWRRLRRLDDQLVLHTIRSGVDHPGHAGHPWLRQALIAQEPLVDGRPMDACLLDALRTHDTERLASLLGQWRRAATADARPLSDEDRRHPFLPGRSGVPVLPADRLDLHPGNFIVADDGELARVDREWLAGDGLDADLVLLRGLLEFAREIVDNHAPHPWSSTASVTEVLHGLCGHAGLAEPVRARWPELVAAEAELQAVVGGGDVAAIATQIERAAAQPADWPLWAVPGGLNTLRAAHRTSVDASEELGRAGRHIDDLTGQITDLMSELDRGTTEVGRLAGELDAQRQHAELARDELAAALLALDEKDDRIGLAFADLAAAAGIIDAARTERDRMAAAHDAASGRVALLQRRLDELERTSVVRLARRSLWPAGTVVRGVAGLLSARPGAAADAVLRRAVRKSPAVAAHLTGKYRRAAKAGRDSRLYYDIPLPTEPVAVGADTMLIVSGWVAHPDMPVLRVCLLLDGRLVPGTLGGHRPDVTAVLGRAGVVVGEHAGVDFRLPLGGTANRTELTVGLLATLVDGTVLERELPPLAVYSAD